jgi:WD40 repeat protein
MLLISLAVLMALSLMSQTPTASTQPPTPTLDHFVYLPLIFKAYKPPLVVEFEDEGVTVEVPWQGREVEIRKLPKGTLENLQSEKDDFLAQRLVINFEVVDAETDGQTLASGSDDQTIVLWDVATHKPLDPTLTGHAAPVNSVAFSPEGKTLASGSDDATIILWDVAAYQLPAQLSGHEAAVNSVAFSPDGKTLASGGDDATIILWDVATREPLGQLTGHDAPVNSVAFSLDGETLASGGDDATIILWDVATHEPLAQLSEHEAAVNSVAFSTDGKTLASGSDDQSIILWDVATCQPLDHLTEHAAPVNSVAFSPDGETLASGSDDATIILWDVATCKPLEPTLEGHRAPVNSVAFSTAIMTVFHPSIELQVEYTAQDVEVAGGNLEDLKLGFWNGTQWVAFTEEHDFSREGNPEGGFGFARVASWGDRRIGWGW